MANVESGLEELATRLADALGTAQIPPTEPMASLADVVGQLRANEAASQESGDNGSLTAHVDELLAESGAAGGAGESTGSAGDPAAALTAHLDQLLAGSGAAGGAGEGTGSAGDPTAPLTAAVEQLRSSEQLRADAVSHNADAIASSAGAQSSSGSGSTLDTVGSAVAKAYESELGPLISGLVSLFGGGGGAPTPPALSTYTAPESVQFEGDVYRSANVTDWGGSWGIQSGSPLPSAQITVQVNTIDSQSFLDHSQDIANAVRQAMLNSNSLNDVVSDL